MAEPSKSTTMATPQQRIRDFYGFDFPDDFFRFRAFMAELPRQILEEALDMAPAHPFHVAEGLPPRMYPNQPHWQDRYYDDLPEFITLFMGTVDGLHWGYYFDDPGTLPAVVPSYWHSDTFQHEAERQGLSYMLISRPACQRTSVRKPLIDNQLRHLHRDGLVKASPGHCRTGAPNLHPICTRFSESLAHTDL